MSKITVISTSDDLAKKLARKINGNFVKAKVRIFSDGESKVTLARDICKDTVIVVQSTNPPVDTNLMHALSIISYAREHSSKVIAVIPYMGYARQDREFLPGEIISIKILGKLFRCAGASAIITVDIHSMMGLKHFGVKAKNITAIPNLAKYFKKLKLKDPLVVSPDQGGKDRARQFAKLLDSQYIALDKKRDRKTGAVQIKTKNAPVAGKDLIIVDDMINTGTSIIKAAKFLKKQKCARIYVTCTHAILTNNAHKEIKRAGVYDIISTNTIPCKTSLVDVSDIIAKAI